MNFQITSTQLQNFVSLDPVTAAALTTSINATAAKYGIDQSARRMRYFLAQSCFETQSFKYWSENLTYTTPERLCAVWPSRFTMTATDVALAAGAPAVVNARAYAPDYVNNPKKLASLVYANRNGNGDVNSGDGFRFRGRGGFHLTFRNNYLAYSKAQYGDDRIVINPDLVAQPTDAMASAGWFWSINGLNANADGDEFTNVTRIINGSDVTVPQRLPVLNRANSIFTW